MDEARESGRRQAPTDAGRTEPNRAPGHEQTEADRAGPAKAPSEAPGRASTREHVVFGRIPAGAPIRLPALSPVQPVSPAAIAVTGAWLLLVCVAAALLLFVGGQDGSVIGGRIPAAVLWVALWLGLVGLRRPRIEPDAIVLVVSVAGPLGLLLALGPNAVAFAVVVLALWLLAIAGYLQTRRTLLFEADRAVSRTWLAQCLPARLASVAGSFGGPFGGSRFGPFGEVLLPATDRLEFVAWPRQLRVASASGTFEFAWGARQRDEAVAALRLAGATVTEPAPPTAAETR